MYVLVKVVRAKHNRTKKGCGIGGKKTHTIQMFSSGFVIRPQLGRIGLVGGRLWATFQIVTFSYGYGILP